MLAYAEVPVVDLLDCLFSLYLVVSAYLILVLDGVFLLESVKNGLLIR
jgi:hypothetical protein